MTPKMIAALTAAAAADAEGGLRWTGAGWAWSGERYEYHSGIVVSRLVFGGGFLARAGSKSPGKNARRVITDAGRAFLAELDAGPFPPTCGASSRPGDRAGGTIEGEKAVNPMGDRQGPAPAGSGGGTP